MRVPFATDMAVKTSATGTGLPLFVLKTTKTTKTI